MRRVTSLDIVAQLAPHITHQDISMWPSLSPEKWMAITIMKLAPPNSYCFIDNQFGMGKSMAREAIQKV
ncbi:hypothetical protein Y1Q_0011268 [Alligator mississippiensis]|uniref:Uncharacterized protein n=1 Tax=Alligator mississippiensis TaxID=8496 RepID=A0A151N7Z7_ALLMI|nr:hypothetical protein Y1Q_0011268 [Alligator mississippiensis]